MFPRLSAIIAAAVKTNSTIVPTVYVLRLALAWVGVNSVGAAERSVEKWLDEGVISVLCHMDVGEGLRIVWLRVWVFLISRARRNLQSLPDDSQFVPTQMLALHQNLLGKELPFLKLDQRGYQGMPSKNSKEIVPVIDFSVSKCKKDMRKLHEPDYREHNNQGVAPVETYNRLQQNLSSAGMVGLNSMVPSSCIGVNDMGHNIRDDAALKKFGKLNQKAARIGCCVQNLGKVVPPQKEMPWRGTGVAIPMFSVRSEEDVGVGEFLDLKILVDWAVESGFHLVQLLPINDTFVHGMWWDSYPYRSLSVFALHPLYLRVQALSENLLEDIMQEIQQSKDALDKKEVASSSQTFHIHFHYHHLRQSLEIQISSCFCVVLTC
ncbi:hypothetical protein ACS0TY_021161 [Phlomoides rotata]